MTETELIAEELEDLDNDLPFTEDLDDDLPFMDFDPFDDYGVCEEEDGF